MMDGKRGDFTANNVLSVVIAVLALVLLFYGLGKLYSALSNEEYKNAQRALTSIMAKADALKEGDSNIFSVQGFKGSKNWYLIGYGKDEPIDNKPDKCSFQNCLCICRSGAEADVGRGHFSDSEGSKSFLEQGGGTFTNTFMDTLARSCQESGYCEDIGRLNPEVLSTFVCEKEVLGPNGKPFPPKKYPFITLDESLNQISLKKLKDVFSVNYQGVVKCS